MYSVNSKKDWIKPHKVAIVQIFVMTAAPQTVLNFRNWNWKVSLFSYYSLLTKLCRIFPKKFIHYKHTYNMANGEWWMANKEQDYIGKKVINQDSKDSKDSFRLHIKLNIREKLILQTVEGLYLDAHNMENNGEKYFRNIIEWIQRKVDAIKHTIQHRFMYEKK